MVIVGVGSSVAKFSPNSEIEADELVGVLNGAENEAVGASNVNEDNFVPISVETVKPTSTEEPYPAPIAQDSAELLSHAVVAQLNVLICIDGVRSEFAKFRPVTVMLSPAVDAPFFGRTELRIGESYVKT
jgi:hypothetical protein